MSLEEQTIRTADPILTLVIFSHGMNHVLQLLLPTLLPTLTTEFQLSHYTAGLLVACFVLPYSILQIPFGYICDRKGRKNIMVLGLILYASATFACGLAQNVIQLGLAQFLAGIGGASYHPVGIPIVSLVVSKQKRGQAMGLHQTGGAIGSFVVPVAAAYIGVLLGWRYSFIILSLFGIITVFLWQRIDKLRLGDQGKEKHANLNKMLFKSATVKFLLLLFIFGLLHVLPFRGLTPFLTTYATEKYGLRLESAAQMLSWLQIMGIFGSPIFGKLSDIVGRKRMLAILILCQSLVMYLITCTSFEILAVLLGAMGLLAYGCLAVTDTWVTETSVASIIGTAVGVVVTASFFIGAIITPMVGFLADQISFDFAFRILSVATLLGLPILKFVKSEKK